MDDFFLVQKHRFFLYILYMQESACPDEAVNPCPSDDQSVALSYTDLLYTIMDECDLK